MSKLTVNMKLKQSILSKVGFSSIAYMHRLRILNDKRAIRLINLFLSKGAFKYRVGKSKWVALKGVSVVLKERK